MNKTQLYIAIHNNARAGTLSAMSYLPTGPYHNDAIRVVCPDCLFDLTERLFQKKAIRSFSFYSRIPSKVVTCLTAWE